MSGHTNRTSRRRALVMLATSATVVTALVGSAIGVSVARHDVTVLLDGQAHYVETFSGTAGGAVADAGLHVGPHDLLIPAASAAVSNGSTVSLTRGRQIKLTVDGSTRTVWVAATNVDDALAALNLDRSGVEISASRSQRIPLGGDMDLTVRTPQHVTVVADGTSVPLTSAAPTVAALLRAAGVSLADTDQVSAPLDSVPADGQTVTVTRVRHQTVTTTAPIPAPVQQQPTAALPAGTTRVVDPGADGVMATTVDQTLINGQVSTSQVVSQAVQQAPRPRVVQVGTARPVVVSAPVSIPSSGGLNWAALARCESGGNPRAVNPSGYYGLYQFSLSTWRSVGGSGNPIDASPAEQTARAQALYARSGAGQWSCGRHLFDR